MTRRLTIDRMLSKRFFYSILLSIIFNRIHFTDLALFFIMSLSGILLNNISGNYDKNATINIRIIFEDKNFLV